MSYLLEGGCQCGEVRYQITAEPVRLTICHCTECKRQSGSAFGMSLTVKEANFAVVKGRPKTWTRSSDSGNAVTGCFCGTCGTRLYHLIAIAGLLNVKPGTLDNFEGLAPRFEAWTSRKAPWLHIDGLEGSFERQPQPRRPEAKP